MIVANASAKYEFFLQVALWVLGLGVFFGGGGVQMENRLNRFFNSLKPPRSISLNHFLRKCHPRLATRAQITPHTYSQFPVLWGEA